MKDEQLNEKFIDHEVRIRIQEKVSKDIVSALRWLNGTIFAAVLIPICLHLLHLI